MKILVPLAVQVFGRAANPVVTVNYSNCFLEGKVGLGCIKYGAHLQPKYRGFINIDEFLQNENHTKWLLVYLDCLVHFQQL